MYRTYKFSSKYCNQNKLEKINPLIQEYCNAVNFTLKKLKNEFFQNNGRISKYKNFDMPFNLTERYKQNVYNQARDIWNSYIAKLQQEFIKYVYKSSLDENTKILLFYINKYNNWFKKEIKCQKKLIPYEIINLSHNIFKHILKLNKYPHLKNKTMILNQQVAIIEKSNNSTFDFWIKLSALEKGNPVLIPIKSYEYFNKQNGQLKNIVQITKNKFGKYEFGLVKNIDRKELKLYNTIALDINLSENLITTSTGNQYGKDFFKTFKKYVSIIDKKHKNRQQLGAKNYSKKLFLLERKIENLIKNEVGRILNRIITKEKTKEIIVENLDFINSKTKGKKLNRYLKRYGFGYISKKLREKADEYNINLIEINPAYTSQECPKCHYVHKNNRKKNIFKCQNCGYARNSHYVSSINIFNRRSIKEINIYSNKKMVKEILNKIFLSSKQAVYSSANPLLNNNNVVINMV